MTTIEKREQLNLILENVCTSLEISKTEYDTITKSYNSVAEWLSKDDSPLKIYDPEILPQGSFMLGTAIKPVSEDDDIDIDLVCQFKRKPASWTQFSLKETVGNRIKMHGTYRTMLKDSNGGRRCWTLRYSDDKYHLDILPSFVSEDYKILLERSFSNIQETEVDNLSIRITDKEALNYNTETDLEKWLKSNPFGYAKWFFEIASRPTDLRKIVMLSESIKPVRKYQDKKLPLQRVVQLLKRHRDIMFDGDDDKPISIIITTLATRAYNEIQGTDISEVFSQVANALDGYVEDINGVKWVKNPVNKEENFADKWEETPRKQQLFYQWIEKLKEDIANMYFAPDIVQLSESMKQPFGEGIVNRAFSNYGTLLEEQRKSNNLKMQEKTGMLGKVGRATVLGHNFFGTDKDE